MERLESAQSQGERLVPKIRKARWLWRMAHASAVLGIMSLVLSSIFLLSMLAAGYYQPNSFIMNFCVLGVIMGFGPILGFIGLILFSVEADKVEADVLVDSVFYLDKSPLQPPDEGVSGGSGGGKHADSCTEPHKNTNNEGTLMCDGSSVSKKCSAFLALIEREARDLGNEIACTANEAADELAQAMFGGTIQSQNTFAFAVTTQEGGGIFGRTGGGIFGCEGGGIFGRTGGGIFG